jgi:hypothetical protein
MLCVPGVLSSEVNQLGCETGYPFPSSDEVKSAVSPHSPIHLHDVMLN